MGGASAAIRPFELQRIKGTSPDEAGAASQLNQTQNFLFEEPEAMVTSI